MNKKIKIILGILFVFAVGGAGFILTFNKAPKVPEQTDKVRTLTKIFQ